MVILIVRIIILNLLLNRLVILSIFKSKHYMIIYILLGIYIILIHLLFYLGKVISITLISILIRTISLEYLGSLLSSNDNTHNQTNNLSNTNIFNSINSNNSNKLKIKIVSNTIKTQSNKIKI